MRWFNSQSRLIQVLLLLIPFVNWITEIVVRWTAFLERKTPIRLILALLVTFVGVVFGWLDVIWCLLFKHLIGASN